MPISLVDPGEPDNAAHRSATSVLRADHYPQIILIPAYSFASSFAGTLKELYGEFRSRQFDISV